MSQEGVFLVIFCLVMDVLGQQGHQSLQWGLYDIRPNTISIMPMVTNVYMLIKYCDGLVPRTLVIEVQVLLSQKSRPTLNGLSQPD